VDHLLAATIASFLPKLRPCVRHVVLMDPAGPKASPPPPESIPQLLARFSALIPTHSYEELLLPCQPYTGTSSSGQAAPAASSHFSSPNFMPPFDDFPVSHMSEQTAAALCYTSGTTGNPKGVLYSHRGVTLSVRFCLRVPDPSLC
jgi:acyl-CoA synthetase (AMP-forming)/AMP-acid ligase II